MYNSKSKIIDLKNCSNILIKAQFFPLTQEQKHSFILL